MSPRKNVSAIQKLIYISHALRENPSVKKRWRTDVIGVACQYSSCPKLKREDFDEILKMTLQEIINI